MKGNKLMVRAGSTGCEAKAAARSVAAMRLLLVVAACSAVALADPEADPAARHLFNEEQAEEAVRLFHVDGDAADQDIMVQSVAADAEALAKIVEGAKAVADHKKTISDQDLEALIGDRLYTIKQTYELRDLIISSSSKDSGKNLTSTATVTLYDIAKDAGSFDEGKGADPEALAEQLRGKKLDALVLNAASFEDPVTVQVRHFRSKLQMSRVFSWLNQL